MKKHTLSLAIVGTLASSLVLSQAVLAEEVETSTEATSSEEVMSDESIAESVADKTSAEAVNESDEESRSDNTVTANDGESEEDPEHKAARKAYEELQHDVIYKLIGFRSFWTEESRKKLEEIYDNKVYYNLSTEEFRQKTTALQNTFDNLKNNFNYTGSWESLVKDKERIAEAENSKEYFELLLLRKQALQLEEDGLTPESSERLAKINWKPAPVVEVIAHEVTKLKEAIANAEKSPEVAEYYSVHRHATEVRNNFYDSNYTEESKDNFDKIVREANISFDTYNNETPKTIAEYQLKTQKLKEALAQLVEKPKETDKTEETDTTAEKEIPWRKEYLAELERSKELLSQWKWEVDGHNTLSDWYRYYDSNYSAYRTDEKADYESFYTNLKALNNGLVYSPEAEQLGNAVRKLRDKWRSLKPWDDQQVQDELKQELSLFFRDEYDMSDSDYRPISVDTDTLVSFAHSLQAKYEEFKNKGVNVTFSTDKSNITIGEDKEITIVATLLKPLKAKNISLYIDRETSEIVGKEAESSFGMNDILNYIDYKYEGDFSIVHRDDKRIIFKLPLTEKFRYFKNLKFNLSIKDDEYKEKTIPLTIKVTNPFDFGDNDNYAEHTALDKHEVSHGETLRYNIKLSRSALRHIGEVDIYQVGKDKPFKSVPVVSQDTIEYRIYARPDWNIFNTKDVFAYFQIDESFPAGEYEIRSGRATKMYNINNESVSNDLNITYSIFSPLYQRFTVKAKQAETVKEEVDKTEEQPKVDNTKPVEDTKTDEQPKVDNSTPSTDSTTPEKQPEKQPDNATPEVKPSDNKKDEPSQPENQPSDNKKEEQPQVDHKPDNTTPEVKPSVDVKPMDMLTGTKGDEKKDAVTKVTKEETEVTTPSTSAPSTPTATPSKPASSAQALPETGELDSLFGLSALAILASVGLVAPAIRRREQ